MFRRFRIAILLYILLFVAVGEFLAARRSTDWNGTLRVSVYLVNGSGTQAVDSYIDGLAPDALAGVEGFFAEQGGRYGLDLEQPFRVRIAGRYDDNLPPVPASPGVLSSLIWSLKMRWAVTRLHWSSDLPTPDITLFAIYHDGQAGVALDQSTALRKGMIAVANLFASRAARGSNQMVAAHEILHTLGASDKYDRSTGQPMYPHGFANPARLPLYPQARAELMAGRIAISRSDAAVPPSLDSTVIGPATAVEIGWLDAIDATD